MIKKSVIYQQIFVIMSQISKQQNSCVNNLTPGSKHKDRLKIEQSMKRRQSNRKSFHRKIARIQFYGQPQKKRKSKSSMANFQTQKLYQQLNSNNAELLTQIQKKDQIIQMMVKRIIQVKEAIDMVKSQKQKYRQLYFAHNSAVRQQSAYLNIQKQQNYRLRSLKNDEQYYTKKKLFQFASQQLQTNKNIAVLTVSIDNKNMELQRMMEVFRDKTQRVVELQMKVAESRCLFENRREVYKNAYKGYQVELSQLFVLRFQINPYLYSGFVVRDTQIDRKVLFSRDYVLWERSKQRKVSQGDIKRFVLIQLYKGWKNILRKLSYQSSQYQVLFGELKNEPILHDLKRLLHEQLASGLKKNLPKHITIHCQVTPKNSYLQQLIQQLSNFDNALIQIKQVKITQTAENIKQIEVDYIYLQNEECKQKIIWEQYPIIAKDRIMKDLKINGERRVFCIVQIPLIVGREEVGALEEVYEAVRKRKTPISKTSSK